MKKLIALMLMTAVLSGCSFHNVEPGYVGVKVYKAGSNKGVAQEVVGVGRYWLTWNEELYTFPVFQQNYVWTSSEHEGSKVDESITIQSKEGMGVGADLGISYEIDGNKVAGIFQKYRKGINELTDVVLRNAVRDALNSFASKMTVDEIYGLNKTDLIAQSEERVRQEFAEVGIKVDKLYLIGEMRLPDEVKKALNAKIEATQKAIQAENEVRTAIAEANKAREIAKGEADANRIKMQSLTPALIQYEMVQVMREKWSGNVPQVMTGGGQGIIPFMNITPLGGK